MGDVTVVVGTFGDSKWGDLARERAIPSVTDQAPVIHVHGYSLADARNRALGQVKTEWVVHLDADDELEPGYIDAIRTGTGDLRVPQVRYVRNGHPRRAAFPKVAGHQHDCTADCLPDGNWLVVGTAVRTGLVLDVGGWRGYAWSEDWDLWLRCWLKGATVEPVPDAVYRAHVRQDSRNRAPDRAFKLQVHEQIHRANFPHLYRDAA